MGIEFHIYIIMGLFAVFSGISGGLIGYYKCRAELQSLLKEYRTVMDCSTCVIAVKVENMETSYASVVEDIKEHTKAVHSICTELKLVAQAQETIGKSHEAILEQLKEIYEQQRDILLSRVELPIDVH
jgi:predicted DNA-binding protein YlxM (UPF0122 family)